MEHRKIKAFMYTAVAMIVICFLRTQLVESAVAAILPQPEAKGPHPITIINGTDWELRIAYTTPEGVSTNDSIRAGESRTFKAQSDNLRYSLAKEGGKFNTKTEVIPLDAFGKGNFQVTPESKLIEGYLKDHPELNPQQIVVVQPSAPSSKPQPKP